MSKITCRKLSNEEALKKYWRSSFVFVEGTGVILEHVPESNETHDQEKVGSRQDANVHSGKNVQRGKNLLPVCCPLRVHSDAFPCARRGASETTKTPLNVEDPISSRFSALTPERNRTSI